MSYNMDNHIFTDGKRVWKIMRLIELSKDLKVFKLPMKHLNIYNLYPDLTSTMDFVENVRRVNNANLKCPIILDDEGYVMDGRHRIAKCLLLGKKSIRAVRFKQTPYRDYEKDESRN